MAQQPDPIPLLSEQVRRLMRDVEALQRRSAFTGTGVHPNGNGGIDSDNFVAGSSGFSLAGSSGDAEFNQLTLRNGIIGNDALTSPVAPGVVWASATNFALTTTLTNILTSKITVPAGFTTAAVSIVGRCFAINGTANLDYLYGQANIAGFNGYALALAVSGNGGSGTSVSPFSTILAGLTPGSTFSVQLAASTAFARWAANSLNTVELSGSILWFR